MSLPWFRFYAEGVDDPKLRLLAFEDRWHFVAILCCKSQGILEKDRAMLDRMLAVKLGVQLRELDEIKRRLMEVGLINDDWQPIAWDKRQYISDSSYERVRKYREKRVSAGLPLNGYMKHAEAVFQRDGHSCVYCGSTEQLCIDHILPVGQGGDDSIENLACACKACNSGKSGRTPEQAVYVFLNKSTESLWKKWLVSRRVTVTVTAPDTDTDTDTDTDKRTTLAANEKISFSATEGFKNLNGHITQWKKAYPAVNIEIEIEKAAAWLTANPKNRKSNYARFLVNWFSRAQDRAPARSNRETNQRIDNSAPARVERAIAARRQNE